MSHPNFHPYGLPTYSRTKRSRSPFLAWLTVLLSLNPALAEPPANPAESGTGQVLFKTERGYTRALHLDSSLNIEINGLIARVEFTQSFSNPDPLWREGVYVFPLPEKAAVNYMEVRAGESTIVATIRERREARRVYNAAKAAGQTAALTEQERPNLFTQSVANIGPNETVTITLRYIQRVDFHDGDFSLRFPMTLTPRYNPGIQLIDNREETYSTAQNGSGWGVATHLVPDATRITPPQASASVAEIINPITLSAQLEAGLPLQTITSGYHPVRVAQSGQRYQISFEAGAVSMDRDLELRWAATPSDTPRAALFQERVGEEYFAMALLVPPHTSDAKSPPIARNVIFVIDTSGSMQGQSIEQARSSLQMALQRLHPRDTFNIIEFNERYSSLFQDPRHATPLHLEQANRFVYSLQADGGTEMAPALGEALRQSVPHDRLSQVVFITDGAVGNETYLFELIHNRVGSARLFTVGIGAAPNSYFMRQAAKFGRGSYTHIGSVNEVGSRMITLFQKLESPVVHGFNVNWVGAKEVWPQKLPDLYRNEPLILTARLDSPSSTLSLAGLTGASSWSQQIESDASSNHRGVATLWAQDKIDALLDSKIAGADPDQVRKKVLKIALAHQLMSPYTSLVAVQQQARRANGTPFDSVNVGNATPHGQRSLPYPQGATAAPLQALIGTLSLLGWLALRRRRWEAAVC